MWKSEFDFGPLSCYIEDDQVTDINYNGHMLWIDHLKKGVLRIEIEWPLLATDS